MHGKQVKSGGHAVVTPQPATSTGPKGPAARGSTVRKGMTTRVKNEKSGGNALGRADGGHHASGGRHVPGAGYQKEQRL